MGNNPPWALGKPWAIRENIFFSRFSEDLINGSWENITMEQTVYLRFPKRTLASRVDEMLAAMLQKPG